MISDFKKCISFHVLSFLTIIFFAGLIVAECILPQYFIKNGGPFDPVADTYPGLLDYRMAFIKFLILYFIFDIVLFISGIVEVFVRRKTNEQIPLLISDFIANNRFYTFTFWFGLLLALSPIYLSILLFIVYIFTDYIFTNM